MQSASASRPAEQWRAGRALEPFTRPLPRETAVGLSLDGRPHTVLMATPENVEDLARGFVVTEAIAAPADIAGVTIKEEERGLLVDVRFAPGALARKARPRNLEGRSSCGLCGVQRLVDAVRPLPMLGQGARIAHAAIPRALAALEAEQALGRLTRATHAAAFFDAEGMLVLVREDVGRHNALDKLAGAMMAVGHDAARGFVVVTSRCSFEMVEKAVRIGCPILVAVSAPTELAITKANEANLTLVALARADGHAVFAGGERLFEMEPA
ncbi:formate dehydrogenase accessory sulfurtransferase FdhD [Caulobacter sp. RHG1]|uniref:formate dehydrogenase accessory sulfurtransferase FdhD n=1 Tax=Caulobacter sp. (strain RHG1) TaxID=2545762 RepID=UPI00155750F0|nr:formate dehydrogenase accessory sulfurtransferase FdhD [Caulobacter sp. RHG1]NQE61847.1 Sulfur carrier protein FdhD [Caulobacter sp. RHG1]